MKIFTVQIQRQQLAKLLAGLGAIAFLLRGVAGIGNVSELFNISPHGYTEFVFVTLAASAVLLLWDIRDAFVGRRR